MPAGIGASAVSGTQTDSANPAYMTEDVCEHVLAWPEARRVAARRLHPSGDV
jgi:hypothetical protein